MAGLMLLLAVPLLSGGRGRNGLLLRGPFRHGLLLDGLLHGVRSSHAGTLDHRRRSGGGGHGGSGEGADAESRGDDGGDEGLHDGKFSEEAVREPIARPHNAARETTVDTTLGARRIAPSPYYSKRPSRIHLVATHFSPAMTGAPPCSERVEGCGRS